MSRKSPTITLNSHIDHLTSTSDGHNKPSHHIDNIEVIQWKWKRT